MAYEVSLGSGVRTGLPIGWLVRLAERFKKTQHGVDEAALLRLAETSSHLLKDLGFVPNPDGTWSNGRHRIATDTGSQTDGLRGWGMRV